MCPPLESEIVSAATRYGLHYLVSAEQKDERREVGP